MPLGQSDHIISPRRDTNSRATFNSTGVRIDLMEINKMDFGGFKYEV